MAKRSLSPPPPLAKIPRLLPYQITQTQHRVARRFGYEERNFRATFNQAYVGHRLLDIHQELEDMFQEVIDRAAQHNDPEDRARVIIQHNDLKQDIVIHMRPQNLITANTQYITR